MCLHKAPVQQLLRLTLTGHAVELKIASIRKNIAAGYVELNELLVFRKS